MVQNIEFTQYSNDLWETMSNYIHMEQWMCLSSMSKSQLISFVKTDPLHACMQYVLNPKVPLL